MTLLTVKEAAELLNVKPSTVYCWAEQELMPSIKLNGAVRFNKDVLFDWVNDSRRGYNTDADRRPRKGGQQ